MPFERTGFEVLLENHARFVIGKRLGSGGFGVVFRAFDRERNAHVALKTLRMDKTHALLRFKQEFRALTDVTHPNLVQLFDLFSEGDHWFFSMELVEGESFLQHVRPPLPTSPKPQENTETTHPSSSRILESAPPTLDDNTEAAFQTGDMSDTGLLIQIDNPNRRKRQGGFLDLERLRSALGQLAEGVHALHRNGKLHCDLKPSNVKITPEGRLVLLDYGLVEELRSRNPAHPSGHEWAGTPSYMSPEQASEGELSEASDWYSVGVMLYEALTGSLPFEGAGLFTLVERVQSEPPPPAELSPDLPPDLDTLCSRLLRIDPRHRPSGSALLEELRLEPARISLDSATVRFRDDVFVGRSLELAWLNQHFQRACSGHLVSAFVGGGSGLGKSALVHHFLDHLRSTQPEVTILRGRCYERESSPFKAIDDLLDTLLGHLKHLGRTTLKELLPKHSSALARIFPVWSELIAANVARAADKPERSADDITPQVLRRRAFGALLEIFRGLSQGPSALVLFVDDLQWGDSDSLSFFRQLFRSSNPPSLLLLGTYREDDHQQSAFLEGLFELGRESRHTSERRVLEKLTAQESKALAATLLESVPGGIEVGQIAEEAGGYPFFIDTLVHFSRTFSIRAPMPSFDSDSFKLSEILQSLIAQLPLGYQRLMQVVAVAARPTPHHVVRGAAKLSNLEDAGLHRLRGGRLLKTRRIHGVECLEIYHDRIRAAVVSMLSQPELQTTHQALALSLAAETTVHAETLAEHFERGGMRVEALRYTLLAAEEASAAFAFERAARLYQNALAWLPENTPPLERARLHIQHADASSASGRGAQAAESYLEAAQHDPDQISALEQKAAEHYLFSGRLAEGEALLAQVLERYDVRLPRSMPGAFLAFSKGRWRLRRRGYAFETRAEEDVPEALLRRIDLFQNIATALAMVDFLVGAVFYAQGVYLALEAGEPARVALALAVEIPYGAVQGHNVEHTQTLTQQARALVEQVQRPDIRGQVEAAVGASQVFQGQWHKAFGTLTVAGKILRERSHGLTWYLDTANLFRIYAQQMLGEWGEYRRAFPALIEDARERGDLFATTLLTTHHMPRTAWMDDAPEPVAKALDDALESWPQKGFQEVHMWAHSMKVETLLYQGQPEAALRTLATHWKKLWRVRKLLAQFHRVELYVLQARLHLALANDGQLSRKSRHLILRTATWLDAEDKLWVSPMAAMLRASLAAVEGDRPIALELLNEAEAGFETAQMTLHSCVVRCARAGLEEDSTGVQTSQSWLEAQSIQAPEKFVRWFLPMPS